MYVVLSYVYMHDIVCLFIRVIIIMSPLFHVNLAGDMINLYS